METKDSHYQPQQISEYAERPSLLDLIVEQEYVRLPLIEAALEKHERMSAEVDGLRRIGANWKRPMESQPTEYFMPWPWDRTDRYDSGHWYTYKKQYLREKQRRAARLAKMYAKNREHDAERAHDVALAVNAQWQNQSYACCRMWANRKCQRVLDVMTEDAYAGYI